MPPPTLSYCPLALRRTRTLHLLQPPPSLLSPIYVATLTHPTAHEVGEDITVELWPLPRVVEAMGHGLLPQAMHTASLLLALKAAGRISFALKEAP